MKYNLIKKFLSALVLLAVLAVGLLLFLLHRSRTGDGSQRPWRKHCRGGREG